MLNGQRHATELNFPLKLSQIDTFPIQELHEPAMKE